MEKVAEGRARSRHLRGPVRLRLCESSSEDCATVLRYDAKLSTQLAHFNARRRRRLRQGHLCRM